MRDYSEFVQFAVEKSGLRKPLLVEKDVLLHTLLYRLASDAEFREKYLFKGGSCLVKCYFGYYRFSVDLDFTYLRQERWEGLTKSERRRELVLEAELLAQLIERASRDLGLEFAADVGNRRFVEFGSGSRLVTYKLYRGGELLKVQVDLVETLLFEPQRRKARTLLWSVSVAGEERVYFREFLEGYREFEVLAYDLREILCEKVRAILTRSVQKLRDLYDLYMLEKAGLGIEDYEEEIARKIKLVLRYRRYRESSEKNRRGLELSLESMADSHELSLFVEQPDEEEFRHALMGALGYSELLSNLEKIWREIEEVKRGQAKTWEAIEGLREEQVKIWREIEAIKLEQAKIWEEIKALREETRKIWQEIDEIKREQAKIWEEIKALRENQEKLWQEVKALREEANKLWKEVKDLKEGQETIRKELEEVRRELGEVRRMQERYCTTLEEEARDVVGYFLREKGLAVELASLQLDREYEFGIYGTAPGINVIGEAKVRAGAAQLDRFAQRAEEAARRWPEKFQGKVVKVFYCMQGAPGLEEAARRLGVWLIVANRQATQPGI